MKNFFDESELLESGDPMRAMSEEEFAHFFRALHRGFPMDGSSDRGAVALIDKLLKRYWENSPRFFINGRSAISSLEEEEILFWQGDLADRGYYLLSGAIAIRTTRKGVLTSISRVGEGEFFEVESAIEGRARGGTAVATRPSEVALLEPNCLKTALQRDGYLERLFKAKRLLQEGKSGESSGNEYLCNCMRVKREIVEACIENGCSRLEEVSERTGAGIVCGTCRPAIQTLLGIEAWDEASLIEVRRRSDAIHSYKIRPSKGVAEALAGQHIAVEGIVMGSALSRCYTLTDVNRVNNYYEITVKREVGGLFSNWLFDNEGRANFPLRVSKPQGSFLYPKESDEPIAFLAAGVGITPAIAFLRNWIKEGQKRAFYLDYSFRGANEAIFMKELSSWSENCKRLKVCYRQTNSMGRLGKKELSLLLPDYPKAKFYICGPKSYQMEVKEALYALGVRDERIAIEEFKV